VLKTLIDKSGEYDFYVVVGDNYYPSKESKLYVNGKTINNGLSCLSICVCLRI